jgi:arylformamidase
MSPRRLIDLSHTVEDGLVTYPGLPAPVIGLHLSREASRQRYAPGTEFQIDTIQMIGNTGTYLDSPFHRYADGPDLAALTLSAVADLAGICVRAVERGGPGVGRQAFERVDVRGRAVLVHTGWDTHWGTERYAQGHPFLTADAVEHLVGAGAALVGIDSLNIDDTSGADRPAHSGLLRAGIPIVEHLCGLAELPASGFRFFSVPVKVRRFGTFPVRAFAIVDG